MEKEEKKQDPFKLTAAEIANPSLSAEDNIIFDRQMRIENWDQGKVMDRKCLLLGIGGLGCTVAMCLCRLGVKNLVLVDKDKVAIDNLSRQILFTHGDISKYKTEAAKDNLINNHIISKNTSIETHNMDCLKEWRKVISLIKESDVVFNMIDPSDYMDVAIQCLTFKQGIPLVVGGTFAQQLSVDFFQNNACMRGCFVCASEDLDKTVIAKLGPALIETYDDLSFIPMNNNPISQSYVCLAGTCAELMVARYLTYLINDPDVETFQRLIMFINNGEVLKYNLDRDRECIICSSLKREDYIVKLEEEKREKDEKDLNDYKETLRKEEEEKKQKEKEEAEKNEEGTKDPLDEHKEIKKGEEIN